MKKSTIEEMQQLAVERNGLCLSNTYEMSNRSLQWQCENKHIWNARPTNIKSGGWCPKCCNKNPSKYTIEYVKKYAKKVGGKCLSDLYSKTIDKLDWQCDKGHVWKAAFQDIKRGGWCPHCQHSLLRIYSIKDCQNKAAENNGKCLSTNYKTCMEKLDWQCEKGHIWKASFRNVKDNHSWCPHCNSQSYKEAKFREMMESIIGKPFKKVRPTWLRNKKGNRMEIDGFNEELMMGFEFQGRQHFEYIPYWHKTKEKFEYDQKADEYKRKILLDKGIKMWYPSYKLNLSEFEIFINSFLEI